MQERNMTVQKRSVQEILEDVGNASEMLFGIPVLYEISLLSSSEYSHRRSEDNLEPSVDSTAYVNHKEGIAFVNKDRAANVQDTVLAGYLGSYSVIHFAYVKSSQSNKENFPAFSSPIGIARYAQSILKEELHQNRGYYLDLSAEEEETEKFFASNLNARIAYEVTKSLYEESGQSKIIKPIILVAGMSNNFDLEVHMMRGIYHVTLIRESPLEPGKDYIIQESKNGEIFENIKNLEHLFFQKREVRNTIPSIETLTKLLDPEKDSEEKTHFLEFLEEIERKDEKRLKLTSKLENLPEKLDIQNDLISLASKYEKPIERQAILL